MILIQDTENVTNTSQLSNVYQILAGFHFNKSGSTEDVKRYNAFGQHVPIKDYGNE